MDATASGVHKQISLLLFFLVVYIVICYQAIEIRSRNQSIFGVQIIAELTQIQGWQKRSIGVQDLLTGTRAGVKAIFGQLDTSKNVLFGLC